MKIENLVQTLKEEVQKSQVLADVCHVLAIRQRNRGTLTITGLAQKMTHEGFKYSRGAYGEALRTLNSLGVGQLKVNRHGRVLALTNITVGLKSLGQAAHGAYDKIHYITPKVVPQTIPTPTNGHTKEPVIGVIIQLGNKPITLNFNQETTDDEILQVIKRFRTA